MYIDKTNHTAFKANFVNRVKIGKFIKGKYANGYASFVKINPFNQGDINALEDSAKYWEHDKFALNIYYAACALKNKSKYYMNHDVYALTSQNKNYNELNSDKILGLIHTSPYIDKSMLIEHIQVNPQYLYKEGTKFKGLGTAILNSLKKIKNKISCYPASEESVKTFYTKNGFIKEPNASNYYIWQKTKG